jgi:crotonobetainyl-CoA:carnitine CoA-transferase CaiB-like acyl-CoA transferase
MFAATAIVAALFERTRTGTGRVIDIAMQDSMVAMLSHQAARYLSTGQVPPSDHNSHTTITPYGMFATADGFVNICVGNDSQFQRFCTALQRDDLAADPRFQTNPQRLSAKRDLMAELVPMISALTTSEVIDALEGVGVPVGAVLDIGQVLDSPETQQRHMISEFHRADAGTVRTANSPWKIDGHAPRASRPAPTLGQHTQEVLRGLAATGREEVGH